jgi:hypothetical protein
MRYGYQVLRFFTLSRTCLVSTCWNNQPIMIWIFIFIFILFFIYFLHVRIGQYVSGSVFAKPCSEPAHIVPRSLIKQYLFLNFILLIFIFSTFYIFLVSLFSYVLIFILFTSLNLTFQDFKFFSWSFDLRRKMVLDVWDLGMLCLHYIIVQCQKAPAKEEYENSTKQLVSNPRVLRGKGFWFFIMIFCSKKKNEPNCVISWKSK